ncbi:MAG: PLD nuclease N-terminal domain-containing protein [Prosthecobacter sp.]|uniref:PLDc N-terminal domain-containing protein n=1 Tax=Prosthecobacter sp. TaxID=1965333 RepID=UPI0025CFBB9C|nr:PLDc N-terminal domain-containing protein [Prosthecobacter sp.]MCF7786988.1 PLD nuclease N-terminal domain-containing protein [Prosthecobacter sp.]
MPDIKFTSTGPLWLAAWVIYVLIYCATLAYLLNRRRFGTHERILWFLVVTFAPVIGILLFFLISEDDKIPATHAPKSRAPLSDTTGTPWQSNPGHTKDSAS